MVRKLRWLALIAACLVLAGCHKSAHARAVEAADREALEETRRQARDLDEQLDSLESRLYVGQATVRLWSELADRHRKISAVSCKNLDFHAESMEALARRDEAASKMAGRRMAEAAKPGVLTDVPVGGYKAPSSVGSQRSGKLAP